MRKALILSMLILGCTLGVAQSPGEILSTDQILKLIPDKIQEFYPAEEFKSKLVKLGTLRYSMAEKDFSGNKKRAIKILLFDYKEAPIMYNQATRKWSTFTTIESDTLILRPTLIKDCTGWESYNVHRRNSQIMLGICDRFFLTVEGTGVDLEALKKVVQTFKFENYPK
jgi:hypothetical protein